MNNILRIMIKETDIEDYLALADPEKCKEYIILGSNVLDSMLTKVNLYPEKRDNGVFYIQSIRSLTKKSAAADPVNRTKNCTEIAYFYIRVFQIFGALMLSMNDSSIPDRDPVIEAPVRNIRRYSGLRPIAPGFGRVDNRMGRRGPSNLDRYYLEGGKLSGTSLISNDDYKLLNKYLSAPSDANADFMKVDTIPGMLIPKNTLYGVAGATLAPLNPIVEYAVDSYRLTGNLVISPNDVHVRPGYIVKLNDIKMNGEPLGNQVDTLYKGYEADETPRNRYQDEFPKALSRMFKTALTQKLGISIVYFLEENRYIDNAPGSTTPVNIKGTSVYIKNPASITRGKDADIYYKVRKQTESGRYKDVVIDAKLSIKKDEDNRYAVTITFRSDVPSKRMAFTGSPPVSDRGTPIPQYIQKVFEEYEKGYLQTGTYLEPAKARRGPPSSARIERHDLRTEAIWNAMMKGPPAKTICVGRALQLLNVTGDRSNVCNTRFAYVKNGSVPAPGSEVTAGVPALNAIASLYAGKDGRGYENFKAATAAIYEDGVYKKPELCASAGDTVATVPSSLRPTLAAYSNNMKRQQKNHTRQVLNYVYMLFDKDSIRTGRFEFNPSVVQRGVDRLEEIAKEVRVFLTANLIYCEMEYKEGVKQIEAINNIKTTGVTAPVEAPTPVEDEEDDETYL